LRSMVRTVRGTGLVDARRASPAGPQRPSTVSTETATVGSDRDACPRVGELGLAGGRAPRNACRQAPGPAHSGSRGIRARLPRGSTARRPRGDLPPAQREERSPGRHAPPGQTGEGGYVATTGSVSGRGDGDAPRRAAARRAAPWAGTRGDDDAPRTGRATTRRALRLDRSAPASTRMAVENHRRNGTATSSGA
jgi:hypothetical protein